MVTGDGLLHFINERFLHTCQCFSSYFFISSMNDFCTHVKCFSSYFFISLMNDFCTHVRVSHLTSSLHQRTISAHMSVFLILLLHFVNEQFLHTCQCFSFYFFLLVCVCTCKGNCRGVGGGRGRGGVVFLMRHNPSLVCMVGITYVYIDTIFAFYGYTLFPFFYTSLYCLVGCLSMIVWTHAVWGVLYACVLCFCIALVQCNSACFTWKRALEIPFIIIIIIILLFPRGTGLAPSAVCWTCCPA